jgi:hypothetical protein
LQSRLKGGFFYRKVVDKRKKGSLRRGKRVRKSSQIFDRSGSPHTPVRHWPASVIIEHLCHSGTRKSRHYLLELFKWQDCSVIQQTLGCPAVGHHLHVALNSLFLDNHFSLSQYQLFTVSQKYWWGWDLVFLHCLLRYQTGHCKREVGKQIELGGGSPNVKLVIVRLMHLSVGLKAVVF